ncbi:MAG: heparinase II/III family protein, partial [Acidimicrobiales bacterium]
MTDWWKIDLRSATRPGDVKWVWELGRHRHLVVLARAALLQPDERRWVDALSAHLTSWIAANPPEVGVHWYSNLEIALRSLNWLQILALAGDQLEPSLVAEMSRTLYRSGRHLVTDLPYTLSSMRNNHLLGDALGLAALGRSFPNDKAARRWMRLGDRLFRRQLERHIRPDGSMIEDSLSYHRFVLEML